MPTKPRIGMLLNILELMRPSGSATEQHFAEVWLPTTLKRFGRVAEKDRYGNLWVTLNDANENLPVTMFSSHTDTVHMHDGKQRLTYDDTKYHLFAGDPMSNCLGADDGTGVWLMLHMIENNIPGIYVFHRDEECGGGGSSFAAKNEAARFVGVKHCVAFDRKGYSDIITHQGGTRTCSAAFATELAKHLPGYAPCDGGSFTDSKNYRKVIPECTNLAVGYFSQHTSKEYQDLKFAIDLATKLCLVPWQTLPSARDPSVEETAPAFRGNHRYYGSDFGNDTWNDPAWMAYLKKTEKPAKQTTLAWVQKYPKAAARLLDELDVRDEEKEYAVRAVKREDNRNGRRRTQNNQEMVVQRPEPVREVPAGSQKEVHRPPTIEGITSTGTGAGDPQSGRRLHPEQNKRTAQKPARVRENNNPPA